MSTVESLRQIELLSDLSDATLQQLASMSRDVEYAATQTLFRQGDKAEDVFFIVSGKVAVAICSSKFACRKIGTVSKGGLVGWSALLNRSQMSAAAQATEAVRAIACNGEQLRELCQQSPELGFKVMSSVSSLLADRLSATRMQLFETCGGQLPEVQIESD